MRGRRDGASGMCGGRALRAEGGCRSLGRQLTRGPDAYYGSKPPRSHEPESDPHPACAKVLTNLAESASLGAYFDSGRPPVGSFACHPWKTAIGTPPPDKSTYSPATGKAHAGCVFPVVAPRPTGHPHRQKSIYVPPADGSNRRQFAPPLRLLRHLDPQVELGQLPRRYAARGRPSTSPVRFGSSGRR